MFILLIAMENSCLTKNYNKFIFIIKDVRQFICAYCPSLKKNVLYIRDHSYQNKGNPSCITLKLAVIISTLDIYNYQVKNILNLFSTTSWKTTDIAHDAMILIVSSDTSRIYITM